MMIVPKLDLYECITEYLNVCSRLTGARKQTPHTWGCMCFITPHQTRTRWAVRWAVRWPGLVGIWRCVYSLSQEFDTWNVTWCYEIDLYVNGSSVQTLFTCSAFVLFWTLWAHIEKRNKGFAHVKLKTPSSRQLLPRVATSLVVFLS